MEYTDPYNISKSKYSFRTILLVLVGMYPEVGLDSDN
jgi:hypothetical protein